MTLLRPKLIIFKVDGNNQFYQLDQVDEQDPISSLLLIT